MPYISSKIKALRSLLKRHYFKMVLRKMRPLKIVCGAAHTQYDGWISLNMDVLDITKADDFRFLFRKNSIDNILLEHVIEHLEPSDFEHFLDIIKQYMKSGTTIRIAVPDRYHPSKYVRDLTGKKGSEPGAHDHRYFYGIDDFERLAKTFRFDLKKIEYFDSKGIFHTNTFDYENGYISRCSKNYAGRFSVDAGERMKMLETTPEALRQQYDSYGISYTSLFVDMINK